jgi:DNA-binding SARP family transcriptional activator/DNA-binding NarL/FixJ family response regulator
MILIADRHDTVSTLLAATAGVAHEVTACGSFSAAVEFLRSQPVELVIVGQDLCDRHGLELLSHVQANHPDLPAIYVTADSRKETIISAMRRGAKDFLEIPVEAQSLLEAIQRVKRTQPGNRTRAERSPEKGNAAPENAGVHEPPSSGQDDVRRRSRIEVFFFGGFRVIANGKCLQHWPSRKGKSIFAYLAYTESKPVFREQLIDVFWPKVFPESARNCLNVAIHHVRQLFQKAGVRPNVILLENDCYSVNPELQVITDVKRFLAHWNRSRFLKIDNQPGPAVGELELAASIYQGDFMQEDRYEEWTLPERENLREIYLDVLESLSRIHSLNGKPKTAIEICRSILEHDNCREKVHRRLMLCYHRIGKRDHALRQFRKCTDVLKRELDAGPSASTRELYQRIRSDSLNPPSAH